MNKILDHQSAKQDQTNDAADFGNRLGQDIELDLKSGVLGVRAQRYMMSGSSWVNIEVVHTHHGSPIETLGTHCDDDVFSDTFKNFGT